MDQLSLSAQQGCDGVPLHNLGGDQRRIDRRLDTDRQPLLSRQIGQPHRSPVWHTHVPHTCPKNMAITAPLSNANCINDR
jgi:hypothetical protein